MLRNTLPHAVDVGHPRALRTSLSCSFNANEYVHAHTSSVHMHFVLCRVDVCFVQSISRGRLFCPIVLSHLASITHACFTPHPLEPSRTFLASTHGDHTVKITDLGTGRLTRALQGHARTPWTVQVGPIDWDGAGAGADYPALFVEKRNLHASTIS